MTNLDKIEALANGNKSDIEVLKYAINNFKNTLDDIRRSQEDINNKIDKFMIEVALKEELRDFKDEVEKKYVLDIEFLPIQKIVFGTVAIILVQVLGIILFMVFNVNK